MAGTSNLSPDASAAIPFAPDDEDAPGQSAAARVHQDAAQKFALLPGLDQRPGCPDERRRRPVRIDVVHVLGAQDLRGVGLRRTALLRPRRKRGQCDGCAGEQRNWPADDKVLLNPMMLLPVRIMPTFV